MLYGSYRGFFSVQYRKTRYKYFKFPLQLGMSKYFFMYFYLYFSHQNNFWIKKITNWSQMCASNSTLFDPNKKIPFKKAPLLMLALRWTPNFFGSIACWGRYLAGCEIWSNIFLPDKFISGLLYPSHSSEIRNFWFDFHIVKNGKFWSVFFDNFIKHKPLISEEGCT